ERKTRPSWDQVTLLYAVRPAAPYWKTTLEGYNHVFENGTNEWRYTQRMNHVMVQIRPENNALVSEIIEAMMCR
ncbi:MAG: hypothetical protein Q4D38_14510, partial [Planctomycetia bacterium]|nr:hypothetical protein [Planctomycetia bacterium]